MNNLLELPVYKSYYYFGDDSVLYACKKEMPSSFIRFMQKNLLGIYWSKNEKVEKVK